MTDNSRSKKRKITIRASPQGIEKAEKALIRLGFETKTNFAKSRLLSRSSVTKFFNFQPIQVDTFKKICDELELNWRETAEISVEKNSKRLEKYDCSLSESNKVVCEPQIQKYKVTVIDESSKESLACIILKGDINTVSNRKILESILQIYVGNSIEIIALEFGSIKLTVKGSKEDIKRLISKFESGELKELNGFPVEDIQVLNESLEDNESDDKSDKWRLVEDIVRRSVKNRNLREVDLSDADLSHANLFRADLSGADLSGADLSGADLSRANLIRADLSGADLSGADLSRANLIRANLIRADLSGADLSRANLRDADLWNTKLIHSNLSRAKLWYAKLIHAKLSDAELSSAKLSGAKLWYADLSDANLSRANLSRAELWHANLSGANLSGVNLRDADLSRAELSRANLSGVILSGVELIHANLRDADLSGVNLRDADLSRAELSRANLSGVNLRDANLSGVNLRDANLSSANLRHANLSGADLSGANVKQAKFGKNSGLTEEMKLDLQRRGAIFEDSPGDRSEVLSRP